MGALLAAEVERLQRNEARGGAGGGGGGGGGDDSGGAMLAEARRILREDYAAAERRFLRRLQDATQQQLEASGAGALRARAARVATEAAAAAASLEVRVRDASRGGGGGLGGLSSPRRAALLGACRRCRAEALEAASLMDRASAKLEVRAASTHYELLGCTPDADAAEIRASYKRLAVQYHPDKARKGEAVQRVSRLIFDQITEAKNVLLDARQRAAYDRSMGFKKS